MNYEIISHITCTFSDDCSCYTISSIALPTAVLSEAGQKAVVTGPVPAIPALLCQLFQHCNSSYFSTALPAIPEQQFQLFQHSNASYFCTAFPAISAHFLFRKTSYSLRNCDRLVKGQNYPWQCLDLGERTTEAQAYY